MDRCICIGFSLVAIFCYKKSLGNEFEERERENKEMRENKRERENEEKEERIITRSRMCRK